MEDGIEVLLQLMERADPVGWCFVDAEEICG